ncbi:MAG: hypothetical protein M1818_000860 [Claussenomyces sp. TS43310]|nr:MAG: hypothetical protein M1818_000860 [Claussenomyces sp. TS43310]
MPSDHKPRWSLKRWFGKEEGNHLPSTWERDPKRGPDPDPEPEPQPQRPGVARRLSRKVIPGLPRSGTFKRQMSELRDNLEPTKPPKANNERRTVSVDRRQSTHAHRLSRSSVAPLPRTSAPVLLGTAQPAAVASSESESRAMTGPAADMKNPIHVLEESMQSGGSFVDAQSLSGDGFDDAFLEELERRWILNLSMHFRDRSNREKFFITYAEKINRWRRVTVSLDYRNAPRDSLEDELQHMQFQRDKSARIYESIRESLSDIQFYETVTNLKLQTEQDRLHVHVTEDIHEVISYPPVTAINHLACPRFREDALVFDSHLSGFVYKVLVNGDIYIKKEIPGPDTVEEFLYEINALHRLSGSSSVIQFGGVIVDNDERCLKGLLISYAERGALIDVLFDCKGQLSWTRRERWAKQIVHGLAEIHEAGFVQGDFTLSNIVIDEEDDAKIIDINRRGCPVGWEPPEVAALIESRQRISMYIGVKSDIYQLGMVLWAIAMEQDEPELQPRPLTLDTAAVKIPAYFRAIVRTCLSDDPRNRHHTSGLLSMFPDTDGNNARRDSAAQILEFRETQYSNLADIVARDDGDSLRVLASKASTVAGHAQSDATHTYVNAPTDTTGESYYYPTRGRSPPPLESRSENIEHLTNRLSSEIMDDKGVNQTKPSPDPLIIDVSPSRHGRTRASSNENLEERPKSSIIAKNPGQTPRATGAAPGITSKDLAGIGEHSSYLDLEFPRSLDDELMTDIE